ncbi:MAG: hypothetical protein NC319_05870 [Butyricicoccus sp.]|nr:hypothetical protein [Butyricicoccus sp.]
MMNSRTSDGDFESVSSTTTKKPFVPIDRKLTLTKFEAAAYSGIGINKIESMLRSPRCPFVLHIGDHKKLVKRREFEEYISANTMI